MKTLRFDRAPIKALRTDDGFILDTPVLTRTGIFVYKDASGKERLEYRPADAVFAADSLNAYKALPITDGHPGKVNSSNVKPHLCGTVTSEGRRDGENLVADIVIHDTGPILAGKRELSVGYEVTLDETPGVTPDGQRYDAIQLNIKPNHLAIVKAGRAGNARLNLDASEDDETGNEGLDMNMVKVRLDSTGQAYDAAPEVANELAKLQAQIATLTTAKDAAEARADSVQAALDTEKAKADQIRADAVEQVKGRIELEAQAAKLGVKFAQDATDRVIREAVIKHVRGDAMRLDGKSDDYVVAAFDMAVAEKHERTATVATARQAMNQDAATGAGAPAKKGTSAADARARMLSGKTA